MAKLKFKATRHSSERDLEIVDEGGVKLGVTVISNPVSGYFLLFEVADGGALAGLTREQSVEFAFAILKEAYR